MGLDSNVVILPDYMQKFLEELLMMVLTGSEERDVIDRIIEFPRSLEINPRWYKGTPKRVNNLTRHTAHLKRQTNVVLDT